MNITTFALLKSKIKAHGILKIANELSHTDTNRIQRWIKDGKIPKTLEPGVKHMLQRMKA